MTYKINGTEILLQPTSGRWLGRDMLSRDGNGHPIYPALREFELRWGLITPAQFNQLQGFFDLVITTGTAVVDLPKYADSTYNFYAYTGCVLSEPTISDYFTETHLDAYLLISRIRT